jgi:hypothetical protein
MYGHAKYTGKTHDSSFFAIYPHPLLLQEIAGSSLCCEPSGSTPTGANWRLGPNRLRDPRTFPSPSSFVFLLRFMWFNFVDRLPLWSIATMVQWNNYRKNRRHLLRLTFNWPFARKKPGSILPFFKTPKNISTHNGPTPSYGKKMHQEPAAAPAIVNEVLP